MADVMNRRTVLQGSVAVAALAALGACSSEDASTDKLAQPGPLPERSIGDPNAPVTVIEYASMTCPHCASFHNRTYPALKEKYIDTGKVRFIFREFPLDPVGATVAVVARCAPEDKFFDVIDVFFKQQPAYRTAEPLPALVDIAKQVGFTKQSFDACLTNQEVIDGVNAIRTHGAETLQVDATPTFFINGKKVSGALSLEAFEQEILPLLSSS